MKVAKLLILLGIAATQSCGNFIEDVIYKDGSPKHIPSNPIFEKYKQEVISHIKKGFNIPIEFADQKNNIAGVCIKYSNGYREIRIDGDIWKSLNEDQKLQLIYHEMGHCAQDKGHNNNHVNGCPESVMRSYLFSIHEIDNCFIPYYNEYVQELLN